MNTHTKIEKLWDQFNQALDAANRDGMSKHSANGHAVENALRDYAQTETPWRMASLLGRETANERQHRGHSPSPKGFSVGDAAKLHLMSAVSSGSVRDKEPAAHAFLTMRQTAVEAIVIGYLCRKHITQTWRDELETLDYVKLMQTV